MPGKVSMPAPSNMAAFRATLWINLDQVAFIGNINVFCDQEHWTFLSPLYKRGYKPLNHICIYFLSVYCAYQQLPQLRLLSWFRRPCLGCYSCKSCWQRNRILTRIYPTLLLWLRSNIIYFVFLLLAIGEVIFCFYQKREREKLFRQLLYSPSFSRNSVCQFWTNKRNKTKPGSCLLVGEN